jgi:hypothetical protein
MALSPAEKQRRYRERRAQRKIGGADYPMPLIPEQLYLQLGKLVKEMPDLAHGPITHETNAWLGRAFALVEQAMGELQAAILMVACQHLNGPLREQNAQTVASYVYQALAKAELEAPARVQGAFIAAGHTLDAYAVVGRVLGMAKQSVLMVDPYADFKIVTEYAVLAPENVAVQILTDATSHKSTLKPAAEKWSQQFGQTRAPLGDSVGALRFAARSVDHPGRRNRLHAGTIIQQACRTGSYE